MMSPAITSARRSGTRGLRGSFGAVAAMLVLGASSTGAHAQFVYGYGYARPYPGPVFYEDERPSVSPRAIAFRLQDRGFTEIARPRFDGTAWVVDATNPAGLRVRLFVDARTGGIVGRQRLDAPYYPSNRVARAAPGYGWTEDEAVAGSPNPDRLVPPGRIPEPGYPQQAAIDRVPTSPRSGATTRQMTRPLPGVSAPPADSNPSGLNPDAKGAGAQAPAAPRRTAKLTPAVKPAVPRASPDAPRPSSEQTKPAVNPAPEPAKAATQPEPARSEPPAAVMPATNQPVAERAAEPKPYAKAWQDPPASEPKRNVRVIGGATVVPGGGADAPAGTN